MALRLALIVLLLLGLAIGYCGGVEQAALGMAVHKVNQASEKADVKAVAPLLAEAQEALDVRWSLTKTSTYLGVGVVLVACLGLYLPGKRSDGESAQ